MRLTGKIMLWFRVQSYDPGHQCGDDTQFYIIPSRWAEDAVKLVPGVGEGVDGKNKTGLNVTKSKLLVIINAAIWKLFDLLFASQPMSSGIGML